jgi:hypothetical protein
MAQDNTIFSIYDRGRAPMAASPEPCEVHLRIVGTGLSAGE